MGLFLKPMLENYFLPTYEQESGFFDGLARSLFGVDENGQIKKIDLKKLIGMPEVTIKADEKQGSILVVVLVALVAFIFLKMKK